MTSRSASDAPATSTTIDTPVDVELADSYLEYALSVIVARAIPDARDGLKPVQRRLLYAMWEAGLRSDRPHRKSVSAVGDTMKKFHPHGDASIYDTLVRLAQPWVMSIPLVDGHGNMGSLDDGPAAARYTEARLTSAAEMLIAGVDEDTVAFVDNFDGSHPEPVVLPAAFPNLIVNGASGIAVGMATSIPPHNLVEVIDACIHLLHHPRATVDDLVQLIPAPDFPTGGVLVGDVTDTMRRGRGPIRMRAKIHVEQLSPRRQGIVATELPYSVGPEKVIARVRQLVHDNKLDGISDVKDLSGRKVGTRLVFEIRPGFDPATVAEELFRLTPLEEPFNVNMVALIDQKPAQCTIRDLCQAFVDHQAHVLIRSTVWRLTRAEQRLHLLDGLVIAVNDIDLVVSLIRESKSTATARKALRSRLGLSEAQADHVLELPLRRLTSLEIERVRRDHATVSAEIVDHQQLLGDPKRQNQRLEAEFRQVAARFGGPRRSRIGSSGAEVTSGSDQLLVATNGEQLWAGSHRGGPSVPVHSSLIVNRQSTVWAITDDGRCVGVPVAELPHSPYAASEYVGTGRIRGVVHPEETIAVVTTAGTVKRVSGLSVSQVEKAAEKGVSVFPGSDVVAAFACNDDDHMVIVTDDGQVLRMPAGQVRPQGRQASGMAGMKTQGSSVVIAAGAVAASDRSAVIVTLSDGGHIKVTPFDDIPLKGRNGQGVRVHRLKAADQRLVSATIVTAADSVAAASRSGQVVAVPAASPRTSASAVTEIATIWAWRTEASTTDGE